MKIENKNLYQLKLFWAALLAPIFFAILLSIYIAFTSNLKPLLGYEGVNNLFEIFKGPMYLITLSFPLVALIASKHRSEQTQKQIHITIMPALDFSSKHSLSISNITVQNKGLGIAKILSFQYKYNGICHGRHGLETIFDSIIQLNVIRKFGYCRPGHLIGKDEVMDLLEIDIKEERKEQIEIIYKRIDKFLTNLCVEIKYTSIFEHTAEVITTEFNFGCHLRLMPSPKAM